MAPKSDPMEYTIRLEAFEGPLDLLLYLIRRAEVEVTDIPVAAIAEQYLAMLEGVERIDIERAGEFLVMAATLTEIKSRMLAPASVEAEPDVEGRDKGDPLGDLVRQLVEYKKYRDAADALERRHEEWGRRFPISRTGLDPAALAEAAGDGLDLEDLSLVDLVEAFARICEVVNLDRLGEHEVIADDTPIELHAEDLLDRLRRERSGGRGQMPLREVFAGRKKGEMLGLFLALLELVRRRGVSVRQDGELGEIVVALREESAGASLYSVP